MKAVHAGPVGGLVPAFGESRNRGGESPPHDGIDMKAEALAVERLQRRS